MKTSISSLLIGIILGFILGVSWWTGHQDSWLAVGPMLGMVFSFVAVSVTVAIHVDVEGKQHG